MKCLPLLLLGLLLISGKVFDGAEYMDQHPDSTREIIESCDTDATQAFANIKGGRDHSDQAYSELNQYILGSPGDQV